MNCLRSIITVIFLVVMGLVFSAQAQDNDINFLKEKAFNGDTNAMLKIAKIYKNQGDRDKYCSWLKKAAEEGNKEAKYLFQEFELIEFKKTASPADFFRKVYPLAENGNVIAMKQLAELYETGDGAVSKNYGEAISWYKKIIRHDGDNAGNCDIMLKISDLYLNENDYNYNEAITWAKKVLTYNHKNYTFIAWGNIITSYVNKGDHQDSVVFYGKKFFEIDDIFNNFSDKFFIRWNVYLNSRGLSNLNLINFKNFNEYSAFCQKFGASNSEVSRVIALCPESRSILKIMAEKGYIPAMIELGDNIHYSLSDSERLAWYKKAADKGDAEGKKKYNDLKEEIDYYAALRAQSSNTQSNLGDEMRRYSGLEGVWHLSTNRSRAIRITLYPSSGRVKFEMWVGRAGVQWVEYPNARYESPGKIWVNGGYDFGPTTFRLSGNKLVGSNGRTYYK